MRGDAMLAGRVLSAFPALARAVCGGLLLALGFEQSAPFSRRFSWAG
jgi:hypothetical protein